MATKQIFNVVNTLAGQTLGRTALTVVDNNGLVTLGDTILSSNDNTEKFLNTLVERIGRTIISYRRYRSMFSDLVLNDMEWGNIIQKIKINMPTATADESYNLTNGVSVDMYKVAKPDVKQKLFTSTTPWQMFITVQRPLLKTAFTGADQMEAFISGIFGEVQNGIELALENLGRNCLNNYMAEILTNGKHRAINLLAVYNTETNRSLTVAAAKNDPEFLRFVVATIKLYSTRMTAMSEMYNDKTTTRHTPYELQKLYVLTDYQKKLETVVQYAAFVEKYVALEGFKEVPYWQAIQSPEAINVTLASDGATTVEQDNIVAVLFDRDALGIYKTDREVSTTPYNAAGRYYNTYYHERDIYFNDLSENFLLFYMAEA